MKTNAAFEALRLANPVPEANAGGGPSSRRVYRALAATVFLAATLLVGAPALGLDVPVLDFWRADKAPEKVVRSFATLDVGAPPGMAPDAIAGEARRVATFRYRGTSHQLWVAPTRHGGFCTQWGCDKLGTVPLGVTWFGRPVRAAEGELPRMKPSSYDVIQGHVNGDYAEEVEIRLTDGSVVRPDIAWVSEPINAGFFAFEVGDGQAIASVVALDGDGVVVTHDDRGKLHSGPPADAVIDERRAHTRIRAGLEEAVLWTAPTRYEGECAWVEIGSRIHQFAPCVPKGYRSEPRAGFGFFRSAGSVFFVGEFDLGFGAVQLRFADGEAAVTEPQRGFLLYKVPDGKDVVELVARNKDDTERFRVPVTERMIRG